MNKLFSLANKLKKNNLGVILIQIDEAHSSAWPIGLQNQPEPHKTFQDRINRAKLFIDNYNSPYPVYIDGWDNQFSDIFRAWPDKFHFIDKNLTILAKSEYGIGEKYDGNKEALIIEDYTDLLMKYIK